MNNNFKTLIQEICKENGIKCTFLSKGWLIMLERNGETRFIFGYKFDFNPHAIGIIADDKSALYEILQSKNIPAVEHKVVYDKSNNFDYAVGCNTHEYVKDYFRKNNNHIVIKPNEGTCGIDVFDVTDINEIDSILDKIFINNNLTTICPFYNIKHEYRVIMLDGECQLLYAKHLPIVTGDGTKTIRELLLEFNYNYFANKLQDQKYDKILSIGEKFEYTWKFNLFQGSIAKKLDNQILSDKLIKLAKQVCTEINLKFGSIDIIQTIDDNLLVLEVNSGVQIEKYLTLNPDEYQTVKNIYKSAIEKSFNH